MRNLNDPHARVVFAEDFLKGSTVRGTTESIEFLSKKNVYIPTSRKRSMITDLLLEIQEKDQEYLLVFLKV